MLVRGFLDVGFGNGCKDVVELEVSIGVFNAEFCEECVLFSQGVEEGCDFVVCVNVFVEKFNNVGFKLCWVSL